MTRPAAPAPDTAAAPDAAAVEPNPSSTAIAAEARPVAARRTELAGLVPDLRAYARFLAHDRAAADDLVQDTLVRALGALERYQPTHTLRAWVFTIQRNVFFEQARRRRTERRVLAVAAPDSEPMVGPHQEGEAQIADLQRLLWTLPPLLREALVLVGAQGLSYEEAAAICGVPVGTVKARVSRARGRIARAMDGAPDGAPDGATDGATDGAAESDSSGR